MLPDLTPEALHAAQLAGNTYILLDVREPEEFAYCHLPGSILIPLGELMARADEVPTEAPVVLICHHGVRSAQALAYLQQRRGHRNLFNLRGGIHAWSMRVDPSVPVY
jgi:rhodanese-related sulfurtransferase